MTGLRSLLVFLSLVLISDTALCHDHLHSCGYRVKLKELTNAGQGIHGKSADSQSAGRILQGTNKNIHAFRMDFNNQLLDNYITKNFALNSMAEMSKRIMNRVAYYLKAYFKVDFYESITFSIFYCDGVSSANGYSGSFDLLVIFRPENKPEASYFAAASVCIIDSNVKRPIVGSYYLNFANMKVTPRREYSYFTVFLHELFHILGFNNEQYSSFAKDGGGAFSNDQIYGQMLIGTTSFKTLKLPRVTNFAKAHFSCESLTGVPIEDDGGSGSEGSHWEKLFLPSEFMNPVIDNYATITEFSMAILRDSGWYIIDTNSVQTALLNKAETCALFEVCPKVRGYCDLSAEGSAFCSSDYKTKSICGKSAFSENCGYLINSRSICELEFDAEPLLKDATETYGPTARCIEWKTSQNKVIPKCHKTECINGNTLKIILKDGKSYTCSRIGEEIKVDSSHSITCPDITDFCTKFAQRCSDDCYMNGAGMCMKDNTCFCFYGADPTTGKCRVDPIFLVDPGLIDATGQIYPLPANQSNSAECWVAIIHSRALAFAMLIITAVYN